MREGASVLDLWTGEAPAKLNLTLDVLGRRPDGYHEMAMVMVSTSLTDTVTLTPGLPGAPSVALRCDVSFLPTDGRNLAVAAVRRFVEETGLDPGPLQIDMRKRIPVCAGMAGGSSDAAAALRGLNALTGGGLSPAELAKLGEKVGSDVPYCVLGGTALARGRGELLTPLPPLPQCFAVLAKPGFPVSTPELFQRLDALRLHCHPDTDGVVRALENGDLLGVARRLYNVFEEALPPRKRREVEELKGALLDREALGASMSGTGPTVFGLFADEDRARAAWEALKERWNAVFLTKTL